MFINEYRIADTVIRIKTPFEITGSEEYDLYKAELTESGEDVTEIVFVKSNDVPVLKEEHCVYRGPLHQVYKTDTGYLQILSLPLSPNAMTWQTPAALNSFETQTIYYTEEIEPYLTHVSGCMNTISIERILLRKNRFIYHCCNVCAKERTLLFSALSGGGKSTQGMLWQNSGAGKVINGDRAVLVCNENGTVTAYGLPIAGSSNIFLNEEYPVQAVVLIKKAPFNSASGISAGKAFAEVYQQFIVHLWDPVFQMKVLEFTETLLTCVPVYSLQCTISEQAVTVLQNALSS